ncbi:cellulase family glycosylhydrolase [Dactylosporangium sp. NPDC049140]|uniref:cellulase family glycosylhydrolase n=1 Tax=Dactylosporangium sp. NPDC049140 TaxID=3155647 RepID=UPI0033DFAE08
MAVIAGSVVVLGTMRASAGTLDLNAWYVLVNRNSGKVLDDRSFATDDGAAVVQWARHGGDNQQWRFIDAGGGYYRLQNRHSGKILDDYNWSKTASTDLVQWSDLNGANQQFQMAESSDGYVRLINRFSGMAVEVQDVSKADGGKVVQYPDWGGANQQWQLVPVGRASVTATAGADGTTQATSGTRPSPASSPAADDAMAAVAAMQPGWNLGNALDAVGPDETAWGNPRITKTLLDNVRAQGFNSIRIPVTWSAHQSAASPYTVDAAYLARVKEVVDWALADGFYVMINVHHDSWQWIEKMSSDHTNVLNRYNALWTQIAATLRTESPKLTFESVNEPRFAGASDAQSAQLLNEVNTSFHRIVRQSGGNNATRLLVLPTLNTSADQGPVNDLASTFKQLNDRNLIATVHFYGYWPFSVNIGGFTRFDTQAEKNIQDAFDHVYDAFVANGIPVITGEYGLLGMDSNMYANEQGETWKYLEYLGYYARTKKITTMLWDNGQHYDRKTFQWHDPQLIALVKSGCSTRSGTASSDLLFVARSAAITSRTLTLNLNGTTFQGLRLGDSDLASGADYTVSGNQLTLTASALTRLLGSRGYGVNATLQVRFSEGTPWRISVITYDTPILSNATGATGSFAIPTQFRGDQLATMEAKYADGSNAGPDNWTPYKMFDSSFVPNYAGNAITLKPALFGEVKDGARVTLTFHFWSGATVTYIVTKSGDRVTGTPS